MRRVLKFLHTLSAIGIAGGILAYLFVLGSAPPMEALAEYNALRQSIACISTWLIVPSMAVVLASGLLAMAIHRPFHDAPWVWMKALSGILIFEATLASIEGPAQRAAEATAKAVAGELPREQLATLVRDEWVALYVILALSAANVAVAIWRPKLRRFTEAGRAPQAPSSGTGGGGYFG